MATSVLRQTYNALELPVPEASDTNAVSKRFQEQKSFATRNLPAPLRTFLESCSAKALSLDRAANKKRRKNAVLRPRPTETSSSSSSSSSSASSSSVSA